MKTLESMRIAAVLSVLAVCALALAAPAGARAQGGATNVKLAADLAAPEGATNANAKGKAKASYKDNGNNVQQKLTISLQRLERRTDYRILIDGLELGVFAPRGNSGTVKASFKTPARGNQTAIPEALGEARNWVLVEVFNVATGELVLAGTFEPLPED